MQPEAQSMLTQGSPADAVVRAKLYRTSAWVVAFVLAAVAGPVLYSTAQPEPSDVTVIGVVVLVLGGLAGAVVTGRRWLEVLKLLRSSPRLFHPSPWSSDGMSLLVWPPPPEPAWTMMHRVYVGWPGMGVAKFGTAETPRRRLARAFTNYDVILGTDQNEIALYGPYGSTWLMGQLRQEPMDPPTPDSDAPPDLAWFVEHGTLAGFQMTMAGQKTVLPHDLLRSHVQAADSDPEGPRRR